MNLSRQRHLILIIEPDETNYTFLAKLLRAQQYDVVRATGESSAVQKLVEFVPDLVICN